LARDSIIPPTLTDHARDDLGDAAMLITYCVRCGYIVRSTRFEFDECEYCRVGVRRRRFKVRDSGRIPVITLARTARREANA
jgi:hypothetical protein